MPDLIYDVNEQTYRDPVTGKPPRIIRAQFDNTCPACGFRVRKGSWIRPRGTRYGHAVCPRAEQILSNARFDAELICRAFDVPYDLVVEIPTHIDYARRLAFKREMTKRLLFEQTYGFKAPALCQHREYVEVKPWGQRRRCRDCPAETTTALLMGPPPPLGPWLHHTTNNKEKPMQFTAVMADGPAEGRVLSVAPRPAMGRLAERPPEVLTLPEASSRWNTAPAPWAEPSPIRTVDYHLVTVTNRTAIYSSLPHLRRPPAKPPRRADFTVTLTQQQGEPLSAFERRAHRVRAVSANAPGRQASAVLFRD